MTVIGKKNKKPASKVVFCLSIIWMVCWKLLMLPKLAYLLLTKRLL